MRDHSIKLSRIIIGLFILGYIIYLYTNKLTINTDLNINNVIFFVIGLYGIFNIIMGIKPIYFKKYKLVAVLFGIFLILLSNYFITDNPEKLIFLGDFISILGVLLIILAPIGFTVPKKIVEKSQEKDLEIIEV